MTTATAHITFKRPEAHAVYHNIAEAMFETSGDGGYLNLVKMTGAEEAWNDGAIYPLTCTIPAEMLALAYAVLHHCEESNDEFLHSHLINPLGLEYDVDTAGHSSSSAM